MSETCRPAAFLLLALILLVPVAHAEPEALVDEDYRFRLVSPGEGWRLLPEAEITRIMPDAIAGATSGAVIGGVVVWEAPDDELESIARMCLQNLAVENPETRDFGRIRYLDRDAFRFEVVGTFSGARVVFLCVIVLHCGHAYQLICWGGERRVERSDLDLFPKAFTFLPGEVRGRSAKRAIADITGVGWRVKDGVFESAVHGLAVEPHGEWRLAIGRELAQMDPVAEVGLVHASPDACAVVLAQRAAGSDHEAFATLALESELERMGAVVVGEPTVAKIAGLSAQVYCCVSDGSPSFVYHVGVFFAGDVCVQVQAWCLAGLGEKLEAILPEVFAAVQVLDEDALDCLTDTLGAAPDPQESVGRGHALRGGLYRSFEHGFSWRAPPGWWRIRPGAAARLQDPEALLVLAAPSIGIEGTLVVEDAAGVAADRYHRLAMGRITSAPITVGTATTRTVDLGEATGRISQGAWVAGDIEYELHLLTTVYEDRAFRFCLYGTTGNLRSAEEEIDAALLALRVHEGLEPLVRQGSKVRDLRMGFSMSPPGEGWTHANPTPPGFPDSGSIHVWRRRRQSVIVVAVCVPGIDEDEAWFENFLVRMLGEKLSLRSGKDPKRSPGKVAGRDASRLESSTLARKRVSYSWSRGSTFYAIIIDTPRFAIAAKEREIVEGFVLLD